jgi:hypothetical protein
MSTVAFASHNKYIEASGSIAFPKYMAIPEGSIALNRINNNGIFDLSLEFGYKQVPRGNSWLETARIYGIVGSYIYKVSTIFLIGPSFGIVSSEHYTYNPNYNLTPNEIENIKTTNFIGGKAALIFGDNSPVKLKIQARIICGVSTESVFQNDNSIFGYSYHDVVGFSIVKNISAGLMFGI